MAGAMIPSDWNGVDWKCWAIEWPDSEGWFALLSGFITTPKNGRYWDEQTGSVIGAQSIGIEIWNRNVPTEESLMSCNDTSVGILEGILAQLTAIANKECCPSAGTGSGSRGSGGTEVPENTFDEGTSGGQPPPGFASNEAWKSNQCNAAQDLINNLGSDLQGMSALTYSVSSPTGIAGALIVFLLTPIPFDDLVGLAGYLIFTGYNYALLSQMSAFIAQNNDELLCILYNAGSAEVAKGDFFDELQAIAEAGFTLTQDAQWVMGAVDWMITNDAFNKLFEPSVTVSQSADCSACGGGETWVLYIPPGQTGEWGTIDIVGNELTGTSEVGDTCNRLNIKFVDALGNPALAHIDVISTTGATHTSGFDFYKPDGSADLIICPSNDCQNTQGEDVYEYALCSNTAFSLFIQWSIP